MVAKDVSHSHCWCESCSSCQFESICVGLGCKEEEVEYRIPEVEQDFDTCPLCNGAGNLESGIFDDEKSILVNTCPTCNGEGFVEIVGEGHEN